MGQLMDSFGELRKSKSKYLYLFYILFFANPLSHFLNSEKSPIFFVAFGLISFCLTIWFMVLTYRFARALGYGLSSTIGLAVVAFIPAINLIVTLVLIRKYKQVTGIVTDFFMFDAPVSAS